MNPTRHPFTRINLLPYSLQECEAQLAKIKYAQEVILSRKLALTAGQSVSVLVGTDAYSPPSEEIDCDAPTSQHGCLRAVLPVL